MSFNIKDKVAIVTGGSSGIGFEVVKLLLAEGAKVAWCGRSQEKLEQSYHFLSQNYPAEQMFYQACDVLDKAQVTEFIENAAQQFGGIDMLINNAGQGKVSSFDEIEDDEWISEVNLKYFSVLNPVKAARPYLQKSDIASIANVNSLLAFKPERHMIATSAARAGLLNLSKSLSKEFMEEGIRVNCILIGMVESEQWRRRFEKRSDQSKTWEEWIEGVATKRGIPMRRLGKPTEAANALVFLASPLSSYTTGSTIDVSGGFSQEI